MTERGDGIYIIEKPDVSSSYVAKLSGFFRRHWKKAAIASPIVYFLSNLAYNRYQEELLVIEACKRAKQLGEQRLRSSFEKQPKVTVFVNPSANNQKALAQIERSLLPMLHLAAMDVRVVKMEEEGEGKELVSVCDDSQAIVAAGGDGTVNEIITGILSSEAKIQRLPLLIAPVGYRHNSLYKIINHRTYTPKHTIKNIISATDSFLANSTQPVSLMRVIPMPKADQLLDGESPRKFKNVFSAVGVSFGPYRDVLDQSSLDKFWYFGPLKKLFVTFKATFAYKDRKIGLNIKWTDVCSGCKLCKKDEIENAKRKLSSKNRGLFGASTTNKDIALEANKVLKFDKIVNEKCSIVRSRTLIDVDQIVFKPGKDCIEISVSTGASGLDFFTQSLFRFRDPTAGYTILSPANITRINCKEVWVEPSEGKRYPNWFSLDNENFEAIPFYAKFYKDSIRAFKS